MTGWANSDEDASDAADGSEHPLTHRTGDRTVQYTAVAGALPIVEDDGDDIGTMFFVSYTVEETGPRPITFLFNGGPGSSSVWLNTGGFGPKRPEMATPHLTPPAPYQIEDNPFTLLETSDLVFLDAIGTGYSRLAEGVPTTRAWGVDNDIDLFARAVLRYLSDAGRWNSPKYLFGESYGTTRAAGLAHVLQNRGVDVNGVVLLSAVLDWTSTQPGSVRGFVDLFPTLAAAARHHGRAGLGHLSDAEFDRAAQEFAETDYLQALQAGDRLPAEREEQVAQQASLFIGLTPALLRARRLRIDMEQFRTALLQEDGLLIGRFDARFLAHHEYVVGSGGHDPATDDPATAGVTGALVAAFNQHLLVDLGYSSALPFLTLNNTVVEPEWVWTHRAPGIDEPMPLPNVALDLSAALRRNPLLRVLVLSGRYDLATPYASVRYDVAQLLLSPELRRNIRFELYESGHMAFVDRNALQAIHETLTAFYEAT